MDSTIFWAVVLALAAVAALITAYAIYRGRRRIDRGDLRTRFGPEYDRAVEEHGSGKAARRELRHRLKRVERFTLRELSPEAYTRFYDAWQNVQARFVDEPGGAVLQADRLIHDVMKTRGYPDDNDPDRQIADLSVNHAEVVQHYRAARTLAEGADDGRATTEDLRQAMMHYRALFADLLREPNHSPELAT
jgi:hypothetical protein